MPYKGDEMGRLALPLLLAITGLALVGCAGSSSHSSRPLTFKSAQAKLSRGYHLIVRRLSNSTTVEVTKQRAEAVALGKGKAAGVTAFLVSATDRGRTKVVAGKRKLLISDRPTWLVLIPDQQVPLLGPNTSGSYKATEAALVDARTGRWLEADELNN
jgi:hypothetical protein